MMVQHLSSHQLPSPPVIQPSLRGRVVHHVTDQLTVSWEAQWVPQWEHSWGGGRSGLPCGEGNGGLPLSQ
eukprot:scaffold21524_cov139-Skeletonema_dohrnii-CCMP3373.AAC.1